MKNLLQLNEKEARDYFLNEKRYCTLDLPEYYSFDGVLKAAAKWLGGKSFHQVLRGIKKADKPCNFEGVNYFGGTYNTNQQAVIFRISEYMQSVVSGKKENCGLSFGINGAGYNAHRMILNGPESNEENKMRLEVTYSLVNE